MTHTALSPSAPSWLRHAAATAVAVLLADVPLLEHVSVKNYIYTNQDTVLQGWRNALLRQYGARSWCFTMAIGGGYLYGDGAETEHRFWAHQNEHAFVTASRQLVDYHRRHPQRIDRCLAVGNIWSELTLHTERTVGRDALRAQWFGERARSGKVMAWFDTSFIQSDGSPSTYTEAIAWYADLLRLLEGNEDLLAVVKPSKDEGYFVHPRGQWSDARLGPRVLELWQTLRCHPRVCFLGHVGDPTTVVAASDLTVTYCFSSITAEALGARKRAFWYEPGERWRGVSYDRARGLVVHGFAELVERVRTLLDETDDTAWDHYLETNVKGLVEDHLDGRGLSRFRAALAEHGGLR